MRPNSALGDTITKGSFADPASIKGNIPVWERPASGDWRLREDL
jgi:hypothetical protein